VDQVLCTEEHKCTLSMDDVRLDGLKCEIWCNDLEHACSFQGGAYMFMLASEAKHLTAGD